MSMKQTYSAAERKAYYMGVGAGKTGGKLPLIKKVTDGMPPNVKQSFMNGWEDGATRAKRK